MGVVSRKWVYMESMGMVVRRYIHSTCECMSLFSASLMGSLLVPLQIVEYRFPHITYPYIVPYRKKYWREKYLAK